MTDRLGPMTLCLISAATLSGCGAREVNGPPAIRYGQSACSECRMLINEERFAASLVMAGGEVEVFDSVECLIRRLAPHPPERLKRVWVHDYDSAQWVDAHEAFYVQSAELATPMGRGLVALSTEPSALTLAAHVHGRVMRFDELRREVASRRVSTAQEP